MEDMSYQFSHLRQCYFFSLCEPKVFYFPTIALASAKASSFCQTSAWCCCKVLWHSVKTQINPCGHLVKIWSLELLYMLERFERSYGEIIGTCQCCGASQWRMSRRWEHPHPTSLDYYLSNPTHKSSTCRRILPHHMAYQKSLLYCLILIFFSSGGKHCD